MKILVTTYSTAFLNIGGGESELVQVVEVLKHGGMHVDIYGVSSRPIDFYDLVMHFSVQIQGADMFNEILKQKKVMLWPNVWWSTKPAHEEILRISIMANKAHKLLFKSKVERDHFLNYISISIEKCLVIPIVVSDKFLTKVDLALAKTVVVFENYVLCLGRVEPIKNQLMLIEALKALGKNGLIVGGCGDIDYFERCKQANHGHIQFMPFIKPCSELLLSLISNSQLVVELSLDPAGRSSLEAAVMKKTLLLADDPWVDEYFSDTVYKADPTDLSYVISTLDKALSDKENKAIQSHNHIKNLTLPSHTASMVKTIINACI